VQTTQSPIAFVGSGAVARALGRALHNAGARVVAVAGRDRDRAQRAAAFIGPGVRRVEVADLPRCTDRLIVAVSDDAIASVAMALASAGVSGGVVLHTCGCHGPEALAAVAAAGAACGVLHPLQTVPDAGAARLRGITFAIGGDPAAAAFAESLAARLDSRTLRVAPDGFAAYHAAAALAGNTMAAVVDGALTLMAQAGVDRHDALLALAPLCRTSLDHVLTAGPDAALTGPVARGDAGTVAAHLRATARAPAALAGLYQAAARYLVGISRRRGLTDSAAARMDSLLDRAGLERV
jgi:predicted short-subunit dehydrogenase-like oxidoreductase (DUF2520 family)